MEWLPTQDASRDLLAVLHPPYNLIVWNADTGTKLWKKSYTDVLNGFSFDPFDPYRLACKYTCVLSWAFKVIMQPLNSPSWC